MKEGKTEKESLERSVLLVIMSFSCPLQESSNRSSFGEDRGGGGLEEAGGPALARGTRWQKAAERERADRRGRSCDKNDSIIIGAKVVLPPCKLQRGTERKERDNGAALHLRDERGGLHRR